MILKVLMYVVLAMLFAVLIGFNLWAARASSIADVKQPMGARVLRGANTVLLAVALGVVLYALVKGL